MNFFGRPRHTPKNALEELKARMTLPDLKQAEAEVRNFYEGRNPYEHLRDEWPVPYSKFVIGFAGALQRCRKEGILEWKRQETIASMCAVGMTRATAVAEAA